MMRLAQQSLGRVVLTPPPNLLAFYPESIFKILYVDSDWYNLLT